jgi:hypothetical protein
MPDQRKPEKKKRPPSSEDIQVPPISKQTAGAVTGAAIGSIAGPAGAVVGGVIGAVVGKAAAEGGPVGKAVRRVTAASRGARQRPQLKKSPTKSRKGDRQRLHAKAARKTKSRRFVRSKVTQANDAPCAAQIDKIWAKTDIVACEAETP